MSWQKENQQERRKIIIKETKKWTSEDERKMCVTFHNVTTFTTCVQTRPHRFILSLQELL